MYFPYLRGRQNELIALRELAEQDLISNKIFPIIEPIKPTTTLITTLNKFVEKQLPIAVVQNPQVGEFNREYENLSNQQIKQNYQDIFEHETIFSSHIMNGNSEGELASLRAEGIENENMLIVHNSEEYIQQYVSVFDETPPLYNIIPDKTSIRRSLESHKVLLSDGFTKEDRNADYLDRPEHFFTTDHLLYQQEGYVGFSDYSIVGSTYIESGFAPYAVAIHIVYFDDRNRIKIKHFVSDSNQDYTDPAGKFAEALQKLMDWQKDFQLDTYAMKQFEKHYSDGTFPNLGSIKKLSIMHHLELMNKYLVS